MARTKQTKIRENGQEADPKAVKAAKAAKAAKPTSVTKVTGAAKKTRAPRPAKEPKAPKAPKEPKAAKAPKEPKAAAAEGGEAKPARRGRRLRPGTLARRQIRKLQKTSHMVVPRSAVCAIVRHFVSGAAEAQGRVMPVRVSRNAFDAMRNIMEHRVGDALKTANCIAECGGRQTVKLNDLRVAEALRRRHFGA
jgi:histone H3/H4